MKPSDRPVGEDDLSAYVDGRLGPDRLAEVTAYLAARPDLRAELEIDRSARDALRERLSPIADDPLPARLRIAYIRGARRGGLWRGAALAAAACLCLAIGGVLGWMARDLVGGAPPPAERPWAVLAQDALSAHRTFAVEIVHPVEVKASEEAHLKQWLSKRLKRRLVVPDLEERFGLTLVGGRLLPAGPEVAALLMYADAAGTRLTLYVRSGAAGETALKYLSDGGLASVSWVDEGYGYAVSAPMDRERLQSVARAVWQDVDLDAARNRRAL